MRTIAFILIIMVSNSTWAQVVYPFNPDSDGDTLIGAGDLIATLSAFGNSFQPNSITLDSVPLELVLTNLIEQINQLQAQVMELEATAMTTDSVLSLTWSKKFSGLDLNGSEFIDNDFSQADFSGSDLGGSNLSDSDFYLANLSFCNLSDANLNNTDLFLSDLTEANLTNANLSNSFLGGADLTGATLDGANLEGTYLTGATMICLVGCPINLPIGFECTPDGDCTEPGRFRVQEN